MRIYFYVVRLLPNKYLIPCPGPQVTCLIDTFIAPWPIEMQSSPVAMLVLPMLTVWDLLMWIPSVFGLSAGELMVTRFTLIFWLSDMCMWNPMALTKLSHWIRAFLTFSRYRACRQATSKTQNWNAKNKQNTKSKCKKHVNPIFQCCDDPELCVALLEAYSREIDAVGVRSAVIVLPHILTLAIESPTAEDPHSVYLADRYPSLVGVTRRIRVRYYGPNNLY